jgi:hypothetical protein
MFRRDLQEALDLNKPILPLLLESSKQKISIKIEPWIEGKPLTVVRLTQEKNGETLGAQFLIDAETLTTSIFYRKDK